MNFIPENILPIAFILFDITKQTRKFSMKYRCVGVEKTTPISQGMSKPRVRFLDIA